MKHIVLIFAIILCTAYASAIDYRIERLNSDFIRIGGKEIGIGDIFSDEDVIEWDKATVFYARNLNTKLVCRFEKPEKENFFVSVKHFFLKNNQGSSRCFGDYNLRDILTDTFYLTDTLFVRTDDIELVYSNGNYKPSKQYVMEYQIQGEIVDVLIPTVGDEMVITKDMITTYPINPQQIIVSVYEMPADITKENNSEKKLITNSMRIVIVE